MKKNKNITTSGWVDYMSVNVQSQISYLQRSYQFFNLWYTLLKIIDNLVHVVVLMTVKAFLSPDICRGQSRRENKDL